MKKWLCVVLSLALALGCCAGWAESGSADRISGLKMEGMEEPLGLDTDKPTFSWRMLSGRTGAAQKSYQIQLWDEKDQLIWDSGTVESAVSVGIPYEGEALAPATAYTWQVTVVNDQDQPVTSEKTRFETSLLDATRNSWGGAQWIGAGALTLDAASKAVFHISANVQLREGSDRASFILGADDYRLKHAVFNNQLVSGENWVRVELDLSGLTEAGGAKFHVYRCGYGREDDPAGTLIYTSKENADLDAAVTLEKKYDVHAVDIFCTASTLTMTLDGVELTTDTALVDAGGSGNTYPNLNSVGFAMNAGEEAVFTDYRISNGGRFARGTLLDRETGATWGIFEGLEGVKVSEEAIEVFGGKTGVLSYADPSWGSAPMVRTSFTAKEDVAKARLYVTAQGIYQYAINGQRIGEEDWLNPGSTEYDALLAYQVYDVTESIHPGENAMGAQLGEGWWTGMTTFECLNNNYYGDEPALMAMLVLTYADGTQEKIVTDDQAWQVYTEGPVRLASLFQGEKYDATRETAIAGWSEAGYAAEGWKQAAVVETRKQFANPQLVTRKDTPIHVIRENPVAAALGEVRPGSDSYIYDMGENVSGVPVITIPAEYAEAGKTVILRFAEILYPALEEYTTQGTDGLMMVENLRTALATDVYTLKEGENIIAPDLTFHGYRYLEITGLGRELPAEYIRTRVLSSLDATATYTSSNELVNQLFDNVVHSTTSNYISIPTDCPQRDERMGWTGDAQVFALTGSYVADTYPFMRQWMDTVRADCGPTGLSSQFCPAFVNYDPEQDETIPHKGQSFGITWNCLVVTIPYNLYMQTGDPAILRDNIDNIRTYVDHLIDTPLKYKDADKKKQTETRLTGETGTLADHLARIPTDGVLLGNAVFIACLDEAAVMCDAVGDAEKAALYRQKAEEARAAWNELFIDPETGKTKNAKGGLQDTQASYATPLRFGVISEENLPKALEHYARTIEEPNLTDSDGLTVPPYSITTGFNATGNVLNALTVNGRSDLAYRMFESTDYASWLYPVTQGATSIWERWNGYTNELGFNGNNSMNSFNHYSFGAVYEWMTAYQLGISAGEEAGYQHFVLQPVAGGSFTFAKGSYDSAYGEIQSGWTAEAGTMTSYDAVVPANTSATLYLPMDGEIQIPDGAVLVGEAQRNGQKTLQIELPAGTWHFE